MFCFLGIQFIFSPRLTSFISFFWGRFSSRKGESPSFNLKRRLLQLCLKSISRLSLISCFIETGGVHRKHEGDCFTTESEVSSIMKTGPLTFDRTSRYFQLNSVTRITKRKVYVILYKPYWTELISVFFSYRKPSKGDGDTEPNISVIYIISVQFIWDEVMFIIIISIISTVLLPFSFYS